MADLRVRSIQYADGIFTVTYAQGEISEHYNLVVKNDVNYLSSIKLSLVQGIKLTQTPDVKLAKDLLERTGIKNPEQYYLYQTEPDQEYFANYPPGWEYEGYEKIYHNAEVACVQNDIQTAQEQCNSLLKKINYLEEGVLKDRYLSRYYMIEAITHRIRGDLTIGQEQKGFYNIAYSSFQQGIELEIKNKDLPTLVELQAHAVRVLARFEQFEKALVNAVVALVFAGAMEREDSDFFAKTVLAAKPSVRRFLTLAFLEKYFRTGCVQIVRQKLPGLRN